MLNSELEQHRIHSAAMHARRQKFIDDVHTAFHEIEMDMIIDYQDGNIVVIDDYVGSQTDGHKTLAIRLCNIEQVIDFGFALGQKIPDTSQFIHFGHDKAGNGIILYINTRDFWEE